MRVMLFQGGQAGIVYNLPGENPMVEIEELLGGELDEHMSRINKRLALVTRAETAQPYRYIMEKLGAPPKLVAGDCVVVRMGRDRRMGDVSANDAVEAQSCVRPLGVTV